MKKGILFVPFMSGRGGTETVIHNLFSSMPNHSQYKLKVYSIGGSNITGWEKGVDIKTTWISKYRFIRNLYYLSVLPGQMLIILKREKPDFIISTNPVMWSLAQYIKKVIHLNAPVIAWYHYSTTQHPIKKFFLHSCDYYLAISTGIKEELKKSGIASSRIFNVLNPIVSDKRIIPQSTQPKHFIFLGRLMLDGQKNMRELINALSQVHGNFILDIYGDSRQRNEVKQYIQSTGLADKTSFHGFIADPWSKIKEATAIILTSNFEGLPTVLCEAISHGVFCVSANMPTGPDDIITKDNGIIYQLHDQKSLTSILQKIVDGYIQLPSPMAIQNTFRKFEPDEYYQRFSKAINAILLRSANS